MRSTGSGPLGALLMLAPLIAVPILAVVGIPQFAPGNLLDPNGSSSRPSSRERRVPEDPGYGDDANHDADDLFEPREETADFDDPLAVRRGNTKRRGAQNRFDNEFGEEEDASAPEEKLGDVDLDENDSELDSSTTESDAETDDNSAPPYRQSPQRRPEQYVERDAGTFDGDAPLARPKPGAKQSQRPGRSAGVGSQVEEEANPFDDQPPARRTSPNKSSVKPPKQPAHPDDAPPFVPPPGAANDVDSEPADEVIPPQPRTRPRGDKAAAKDPVADLPETAAKAFEEEPVVESTEPAQHTDELTWQTATKQLRALGVGKSKQHFTYVEDRNLFLFTCTAIHRDDSTQTQRFQAEAEEPLLAVKQVLEKLETWQDTDMKPRTRSRTGARASL